MAIVEMKRMSLLAPAQDEQALLGALQRLSCVHITEPQEEADGFDRQSAPAQLPGLDQFIAAETGIPVQVARNPLDCTVLGAGYLASNLELLGRIGKNHPLTE